MEYQKAREYIDEAHRFGGKMGLGAIRKLLLRLGNPQEDLKFIHIAGTNGKGSVGAYLDYVLRQAGYRTGRFVSPTLYEYRERIQCGGEYISREDFGAMMDPVAAALEEMKRAGEELPSPFEIETALSFLYFKEKECSPVLLECGMGGQNDATNVITTTELAVLTSVSMDHMEYLGGTLGEIAAQKAGIIKPGSSAVTCRQLPEAEKEIENACRRLDVPLTVADCSQAEVYEAGIRCTRFSWGGHTVTIHLPGAHQLQNAVVALAGIDALRARGWQIGEEHVARGFAETVWNGRFTILRERPWFVLDGAHNPDAAGKLQESIRMYFAGKRLIFLFGVYKDKQYEKIASILAPMADEIVTMETPEDPRALPARELAEAVRQWNPHVQTAENLKDAVRRGFELAREEDVIVAFGSLSFAGDITRIVAQIP